MRSTSRAVLLATLSMVFVGSIASSAYAGYYKVTYSGGGPVRVVGPSGVPWTRPYVGTQGFREGKSVSCDPPTDELGPAIGPGSVTCSGQMTAHFEWIVEATDRKQVPPDCIVIEQFASASWQGESGSCSNGLGHPATGTSQGQSSSGFHYRLVNDPPGEFDILCTPTAHAQTSQWSGCVAEVYYRASATPIELAFHGTVWSGELENVLMGQNVGVGVASGQYEQTNHSWKVSGEWFYSAQWGQGAESHCYNEAPDSWYYEPNVQMYFFRDQVSSVTCTVDIKDLNGNTIGTANLSEPVKAWSPYIWEQADTSSSNYMKDSGGGIFGVSAGLWDSGPEDWNPPGITFQGRMGTPALFRYEANQGAGKWCYVQLCIIDQWVKKTGVWWPVNNTGSTWELDNSFPYGLSDYSSGIYDADSTADQPSMTWQVDDSPNIQWGFAPVVAFTVDDGFKMFYAFLPPKSPRPPEWVPVHVVHWLWEEQAERLSTFSRWPLLGGVVRVLEEYGMPTTEMTWQETHVNSGG
jgi:hypothetical protein